jgi:hypothetical protein
MKIFENFPPESPQNCFRPCPGGAYTPLASRSGKSYLRRCTCFFIQFFLTWIKVPGISFLLAPFEGEAKDWPQLEAALGKFEVKHGVIATIALDEDI